jgi:hypothetical protein
MNRFFRPNIESPGRLLRGTLAVLLLAAAAWAIRSNAILAIFLLIGGLFCAYEAARGWCIARACGLRTRI